MVIFIDDLDRCSKENVLDVLETINFLFSSGNCYIILGMARDWVETCVALGFKELAEETSDGKNAAQHREYRLEFARKYLQKLINIEVPLPRLDTRNSLRLLPDHRPPEAESNRLETLWNTWAGWFRSYRNAIFVLVFAGLAVATGWGLSRRIGDRMDAMVASLNKPKADTPPAEIPLTGRFDLIIGQAGNSETRISGAPAATDGPPLPKSEGGSELVLRAKAEALEKGIVVGRLGEKEAEAELVLRRKVPRETPGAEVPEKKTKVLVQHRPERQVNEDSPPFRPSAENAATLSVWAPLPGGLILAGLAVWLLLRRPVKLTQDSDDFVGALKTWHPWIAAACTTPRMVKRYLNWVRYLAMRYRAPDAEARGWLNNILGKLIRSAPSQTEQAKSEAFDERMLVALSAIYQYRKEWVVDDQEFVLLGSGNFDVLFKQEYLELRDDHLETRESVGREFRLDDLIKSLRESSSTFSKHDWEKAKKLRERFLDAFGDVQVG